MPNRIIREAILSSEKMASLGWPEEVFYRRLMSIVDDYGRYEASHQLLRSRCYPLQTDAVRVTDISRWMAACQTAGLILCYAVQGKQYLEISNFQQQQRTASKYPAPLSPEIICEQAIATAHLGVSVFGVVSEVGGVPGAAAPTPPARKRKTSLPTDFGLSEAVVAWAKGNGFGQLDQHLDAFKRKATAKGYTYVDWDAAFMEAVREDWAKLRGRGVNGAAPAGESATVPGKAERDPALVKLDNDLKQAAPIPLETLERMARIRQGAH